MQRGCYKSENSYLTSQAYTKDEFILETGQPSGMNLGKLRYNSPVHKYDSSSVKTKYRDNPNY